MEAIKDLQEIKDLKEKNGLKASRKRKLKEVRRKLSDISEVIEAIAIEEEKFVDKSNPETDIDFNIEKEILNIENLHAAVHAIQASVLFIDSTLD